MVSSDLGLAVGPQQCRHPAFGRQSGLCAAATVPSSGRDSQTGSKTGLAQRFEIVHLLPTKTIKVESGQTIQVLQ